ncbi:MAG TPA: M56 family metallopeptidase [Streptosporangiaceae bacterium]|nr:M56 family metallopeptidase [Streptosporangiaceae bacterium]
MNGALWLAAALGGLAVAGLAVAGLAGTAPRLGATVELLTLAVIGLVPPLLLACAAATVGTAAGTPGRMIGGLCVLADGPLGLAQMTLYGLALVAVGRTSLAAKRAVAAAHRAELRGLALAGATPRRLADGQLAWVVPSGQLAAYSGGLRHPRPVVTTGLLSLLGPAEQEAVLRHESAHIRLGHPRILLFGAAIADSYGWLPPARWAWAGLRRDLEAAADDEAVSAAGPGPLLCALAKVTLAQAVAVPGAAGFADSGDLRYRIRRLREPHPRRAGAALTLGLVGGSLTAGLAVVTCQLLNASAPWTTMIPALAGFGYLGWRPAWASRTRSDTRFPRRGRRGVSAA